MRPALIVLCAATFLAGCADAVRTTSAARAGAFRDQASSPTVRQVQAVAPAAAAQDRARRSADPSLARAVAANASALRVVKIAQFCDLRSDEWVRGAIRLIVPSRAREGVVAGRGGAEAVRGNLDGGPENPSGVARAAMLEFGSSPAAACASASSSPFLPLFDELLSRPGQPISRT